jgi:hypothetical protein
MKYVLADCLEQMTDDDAEETVRSTWKNFVMNKKTRRGNRSKQVSYWEVISRRM